MDFTNNQTIYEWNTENLNDTTFIQLNYFCVWDLHQSDLPIHVLIKQENDESVIGEKQLVFGTANNTVKWDDPNI